jgi:hypothetical protein
VGKTSKEGALLASEELQIAIYSSRKIQKFLIGKQTRPTFSALKNQSCFFSLCLGWNGLHSTHSSAAKLPFLTPQNRLPLPQPMPSLINSIDNVFFSFTLNLLLSL